MNIDDIKQLVQLMVDNDLSELNISDGERTIALKRGGAPAVVAAPGAPAAGVPAPGAVGPVETLVEIKSPMVGTFYAAPSPDSDPYVSVGATVAEDTVVCIVEAMKVMNEIKAETSGVIAEVVAENGKPVQFGQVLFRVR